MIKTVVTKSGISSFELTQAEELEVNEKSNEILRNNLMRELEVLMGVFASKGLIWFIKREIAAGRITKPELPQQMIDAYDRIAEIEGELNG